jgi:hypothetical protein
MTPALALVTLLALQETTPPPPTPPPPEPPKRYADQGTSHFGLSLGIGGGSGGFLWGGGLQYGYFVIDRVAPGIETQVSGGTGLLTSALLLGTLRVVPVRTDSLAVFVVGRGGRVLVSDHADGWGVGGGGGIIFFTGAHFGIALDYDVLRLTPSSFCSDLSRGCTLQGFGVGLVAAF